MDQKKNTTFKYRTRRIGGTNAILTTVAGTYSIDIHTKQTQNVRGTNIEIGGTVGWTGLDLHKRYKEQATTCSL